jgi:hypothetical protein
MKVLVATPAPSEWNGLPVNTAAGLESGLMERIGPIWNIMGVAMAGTRCRSRSRHSPYPIVSSGKPHLSG